MRPDPYQGPHERTTRYHPALVGCVLLAAAPVRATFPGLNGEVAYRTSVEQVSPISGTVSGQITAPPATSLDRWPRWSRDGRQVAFVRTGTPERVMLLDMDSGELREVVNTNQLPHGLSFHGFFAPAWTDDGRISFVFSDRSSGGIHAIYTVEPDGTGLTRTVNNTPAAKDTDQWRSVELDWSVSGRLVYQCFKKESPFATVETLVDTCIFDRHTGTTTRLGVKSAFPRWSPLGDEIVYAGQASNPLPGGGGFLTNEIFAIDAAGGAPRRLTFSQQVACNTSADPVLLSVVQAAPSPDGESIVFAGVYGQSSGGTCATTPGLWSIPAAGGPGTLVVADRFAIEPDWQPVVPKLTVQVDDGHDNPLRGVRVELRTLQGNVISDDPKNPVNGDYDFADAGPGTWVIRVTLIDSDHATDEDPSFDVRHAVTPQDGAAPVWVEREITIPDDVESTIAGFSITDGPHVVLSSLAQNARHRLDDLANIFFRVRQFADWAKANLVESTGETLEFHTFATIDPWFESPVGGDEAYYQPGLNGVVLGAVLSEYASRDGVSEADLDDEAPENAEWHEFAHHLHEQFVEPAPRTGENHAGYPNPDTSDSLTEGFAAFLAGVAGQDIEGTSDSQYDSAYDLEWHHKAWAPEFQPGVHGYTSGNTDEDDAVSALLWDLVDDAADTAETFVIGASGEHLPADFTDEVQLTIGELWELLTTARPHTVMALRDAFGRDPADVTLDLDGDLLPDVSVLDQVFLMHGFFPIADDQTLSETHASHHYDVALAQRENAGAPRNGAVGRSDHRTYDALGDVIDEQIPRFKNPRDPKANVLVTLRDETGTPLTGDATLVMTIHYPGGRE